VIEHLDKGDLKSDGVVSSIYQLEDWKEAFDKATGKDGDFKVAFKF
jgi:L-iditol 2-dehydrogenase